MHAHTHTYTHAHALGWQAGPRFDSAPAPLPLQTLWFMDSFVTVCLTVNATLEWLSPVPILMQNHFGSLIPFLTGRMFVRTVRRTMIRLLIELFSSPNMVRTVRRILLRS